MNANDETHVNCQNKRERYRKLIEKVKASYPPEGSARELTWCDDCDDEINLWTYWQGRGSLDPEILLVGQDWGNPAKLIRPMAETKAGPPYDESKMSPTDKNLETLFDKVLGIPINKKGRNKKLFFTNLVLGYRTGNESGGMKAFLMKKDKNFFKELVDILCPHVVICLGQATFKTALAAYKKSLPYKGKFIPALDARNNFVDIDKIRADGSVRFYGVGHCGALGCINRIRYQDASLKRQKISKEDGEQKQIEDWKEIKNYLDEKKIIV